MDDALLRVLHLLARKLNAAAPSEVKKKDFWDKAAVVSGFLSSVVIAIVGLLITSSLQRSQQSSAQALATAQLELGRITAERDRKLQESRLTADLLSHLLSTDSAHRQIAIIALRETVSAKVSDSVLAVLAQRDSNSSVRATAIQQLGSSSDRAVAQKLTAIAADTGRSNTERTLARQATGTIAYNSSLGPNMFIGVASGGGSMATETSELKHGVFTYALLEALSGKADFDHDGRISIGELTSFMIDRTAEITEGETRPAFYNSIVSLDDVVLPRPGKVVALSIGVGRYASNGVASLQYACNDAQAFNQLLSSKYRASNASALCDEKATRAAILSRLSELGREVDSETSVFIYLSGHGFTQDGIAFIVPYDGVISQGSVVLSRDSMVSLDDMRRSLELLSAGRVFWFIDSGYSSFPFQFAK